MSLRSLQPKLRETSMTQYALFLTGTEAIKKDFVTSVNNENKMYPPISKVFREIGLADELGSGMRNTYKYTKLYSGGEPQFVEGDVFRTIIPLAEAATIKVGPVSDLENTPQVTPQDTTQVTPQDTPQVTPQDTTRDIPEKLVTLIEFCSEPRNRKEMMDYMSLTDTKHFRKTYLLPLLEKGKLRMTIPDKPNSRNQKYIKV